MLACCQAGMRAHQENEEKKKAILPKKIDEYAKILQKNYELMIEMSEKLSQFLPENDQNESKAEETPRNCLVGLPADMPDDRSVFLKKYNYLKCYGKKQYELYTTAKFRDGYITLGGENIPDLVLNEKITLDCIRRFGDRENMTELSARFFCDSRIRYIDFFSNGIALLDADDNELYHIYDHNYFENVVDCAFRNDVYGKLLEMFGKHPQKISICSTNISSQFAGGSSIIVDSEMHIGKYLLFGAIMNTRKSGFMLKLHDEDNRIEYVIEDSVYSGDLDNIGINPSAILFSFISNYISEYSIIDIDGTSKLSEVCRVIFNDKDVYASYVYQTAIYVMKNSKIIVIISGNKLINIILDYVRGKSYPRISLREKHPVFADGFTGAIVKISDGDFDKISEYLPSEIAKKWSHGVPEEEEDD